MKRGGRAAALALVLAGCQWVGDFEDFSAAGPDAGVVGQGRMDSGASPDGLDAGDAVPEAGPGDGDGSSPDGSRATGDGGTGPDRRDSGPGAEDGDGGAGPCDALFDAPPDMVAFERPDLCVWIDVSEVSRAQWTAFVDAGGARASHESCASQPVEVDGVCEQDPRITMEGDHPMVCVDWCDAQAYCEWKDKTLCPGDRYAFGDPDESTWYLACGGYELRSFSYGDTYLPDACNGADNSLTGCDTGSCTTVPVTEGCVGQGGVRHLTGNVAEWSDECSTTEPRTCLLRGGAFNTPEASVTCHSFKSADPLGAAPNVGFRCCVTRER